MSYVVTAHTVVPLIIQIRGSVLITQTRNLKLVKWQLADCWMSGMEGGGTLPCLSDCSVLITHARSLKLVKWWLADCWMSGVEGGGTLSYPAGCSGLSLTHTVGFLDHISQGSQGGQALAS